MKKLLTVVALSFVLAAGAAFAQPFYVAGDMNGWNAETLQMVDDGTSGDAVAGDGIHSLLVTIEFAGRHEWKAALFGWGDSWPYSGNSWFYTTSDNEDVLFTFNINTVGDGWLADGYWPYTDHSLAIKIVGDVQVPLGDPDNWNNATGSLFLHDDGLNGDAVAGDGYYTLLGNIGTPATYYWKVVVDGTWDAIGADGAGVNAANMELVLSEPCLVYFVLNANLGRLYASCEAPVDNEVLNWSNVKSLYR
ncbi:hypothetical protein KKG45_02050 [bacterium]|nr:hypothetical protein [bacterium]MBU1072010.1 hypothetical protein [bacterium]MBU1676881.1 hypothetical protein [bacterium]